jgi:hypothetical protein
MENTAPPSGGCGCCAVQKAPPAPPPVDPAPPPSRSASFLQSAGSLGLSIALAFFPKCPMCWAAYMSIFGGIGLANIPYQGWLFPVLTGMMLVHVGLLYRKIVAVGYGPFALSLAGIAVLLSARLWFSDISILPFCGLALMIASALWNNFSSSFSKQHTLSWLQPRN